MKYTVLEVTPKYSGPKVQVGQIKIRIGDDKIVEWDKVMMPNVVFGIPVNENMEAILVKEWRPGPEKELTVLVGARYEGKNDKQELARELREELGLLGGKYTKLIDYISNGPHVGGFKSIYLIEDYELGLTNYDEDENIEVVKIPVNILYQELLRNHTTTTETLLVAKILQDKN